MSFRRGYYYLKSNFAVSWRINRDLVLWLGLFAVIGVVIGIVVVTNPRITPIMITQNLLDVNILRVVRPNTSFGSIFFGRIFYFLLLCAFAFLVSLHRWTVWIVYVLVGYRGFVVVVNLYWIIAQFGFVVGVALFIVYLLLFIILLALTVCVMMHIIRECSWVRSGGFRGNLRWKDWQRICIIFVSAIVIFTIVEWLLYWTILSKFVYVVPPHI